jgi:hypothetical protein
VIDAIFPFTQYLLVCAIVCASVSVLPRVRDCTSVPVVARVRHCTSVHVLARVRDCTRSCARLYFLVKEKSSQYLHELVRGTYMS